jgi:hypothetical protein
MVWTRERISYDLIGHKQYLIEAMQITVVKKSGLYVTAIATTIIGTHTYMC